MVLSLSLVTLSKDFKAQYAGRKRVKLRRSNLIPGSISHNSVALRKPPKLYKLLSCTWWEEVWNCLIQWLECGDVTVLAMRELTWLASQLGVGRIYPGAESVWSVHTCPHVQRKKGLFMRITAVIWGCKYRNAARVLLPTFLLFELQVHLSRLSRMEPSLQWLSLFSAKVMWPFSWERSSNPGCPSSWEPCSA